MEREQFKFLAAGKFAYGKPTIKHEDMQVYIDGALMAFDLLQKMQTKQKTDLVIETNEPLVVKSTLNLTENN